MSSSKTYNKDYVVLDATGKPKGFTPLAAQKLLEFLGCIKSESDDDNNNNE